MTTDEALEEISMLEWGGVSWKSYEVVEFVKQLQAEVEMFENRESMALEYAESLKNCANCRHIIWDGEVEVLCSKNWVGDKFEKCRHWQKEGD